MKLLLIGIDGLRVDLALPAAFRAEAGFHAPPPGDPRFAGDPREPDAPCEDDGAGPGVGARTLEGLAAIGRVVPVWMTPPTDSGPGWSSLLTGTTHEENGVWWNEFEGHRLARTPDLLSRIWFAEPRARTFAAATWTALLDGAGPGPVVHERVDQQRGGRHAVFLPDDRSEGCRSADRQVISRATRVLGHEGPDAAFVHVEGVDEAGHAHGSASEEYAAAVRVADGHVDSLVAAVAERVERLDEEWLVAVITDHGHKVGGGHGEDEPIVRRSFLLLRVLSRRPEPTLLEDLPPALRAEEVAPLLLRLLGVRDGSWEAGHEVGAVVGLDDDDPAASCEPQR